MDSWAREQDSGLPLSDLWRCPQCKRWFHRWSAMKHMNEAHVEYLRELLKRTQRKTPLRRMRG